ncbi:MAG TPA: hypothetical protein VID24_04240 [Candidatus Eremiobacteraceae bacterium]
MTELAQPFLEPWGPFFTMTATAAATLIGLMFVVVTLVTGIERTGDSEVGISTFSTPTVIHFGAALLVSAILIAPWPYLAGTFALVTLVGLAGVAHMSRVAGKARRLTVYDPDMEDWVWYTIFPFVAYAAVLVGGITVPFAPRAALWILGATTTLLIFIGIRNAWDVVTYLAMERVGSQTKRPDETDRSVPE